MEPGLLLLGLLQKLHEAGITIRAEGDRLIASPGERLTGELRTAIRENKQALLAGIRAHEAAAAAVGMELAPGRAHECMHCDHLEMRMERHVGPRRVFWWRCRKGYELLEGRNFGERVLLAPPGCHDFEQWKPGQR